METKSPAPGPGSLVGEKLRGCPSFSEIDRLRLAGTSRGHALHGTAVVCAICLAALGQKDYADLEDYAGGPGVPGGRLPSPRRRPSASESTGWARKLKP
ncbi:MAG: hypothetical protein J6Y80_00930 [Victivallales bacterium]|nr:hypothetical protein [Victivallales bacterium]